MTRPKDECRNSAIGISALALLVISQSCSAMTARKDPMTIEEFELLAKLDDVPLCVSAENVPAPLARLEAANYVTHSVVGQDEVEFRLTDLGRFALRLRET